MRWYIHITSVHQPTMATTSLATICGFASTQSSKLIEDFSASEARLLGGNSASLIPVEPNNLAVDDLLVVRAPQSCSAAAGRFVRARLVDSVNKAAPEPLHLRLMDFSSHLTGKLVEVTVPLDDCRQFNPVEKDADAFAKMPALGRSFRLANTDQVLTDSADYSLTGSLAIVTLAADVEQSDELPIVQLHRLTADCKADMGLPSPRHRHSGSRHWVGDHWSEEPLHLAESGALANLELNQLREYIIHCNCLAGRELALKLFEERIRGDCATNREVALD